MARICYIFSSCVLMSFFHCALEPQEENINLLVSEIHLNTAPRSAPVGLIRSNRSVF